MESTLWLLQISAQSKCQISPFFKVTGQALSSVCHISMARFVTTGLVLLTYILQLHTYYYMSDNLTLTYQILVRSNSLPETLQIPPTKGTPKACLSPITCRYCPCLITTVCITILAITPVTTCSYNTKTQFICCKSILSIALHVQSAHFITLKIELLNETKWRCIDSPSLTLVIGAKNIKQ
jgi:hypothetical protein